MNYHTNQPQPGVKRLKTNTMIKAKFKVQSVTQFEGSQLISAQPVTTGSEENKSFSRWTPSGKLEMTINDGTRAFDALKPGQEFYMEITPIEQ